MVLACKQNVITFLPVFPCRVKNARRFENDVYAAKYVRESAGGKQGAITLGSILQFVTGLDEELPLGFAFPPSIHFVAAPQNVNGPSFQQVMLVVEQWFYQGGPMTFLCQRKRRGAL